MPDGLGGLLGSMPRQPPSNVQAEQALLGAILANNKAYDRVADFLLPEHFADPINGRVFLAARERIEKGMLADAVTLKAEFENAGILDEVGGTAYLTQLLVAMVGIINAGDYGRAVYDTWQRRQLIEIGEVVVNNAFDGSQPTSSIISDSASQLDAIMSSSTSRKATSMADAIEQAISRGEMAANGLGLSGVRTGSVQLDDLFGDLEAGGVYILAARPGDGKSTLALQIADYNAKSGVPVYYASTEMQAAQLGRRALSLNTGLSSKALKRGEWSQADQIRIADAWNAARANKDLFTIEDAPGLNTRVIGSRVRGFVRKHTGKVGLIVIDHMHDLSEFSESDMIRAVGSICRGAKSIAKQTGWPILLLAQMNRGKDVRENKRPEMSDLYGGMQIEAVAEGIILLDRPEKRLDQFEPEHKSGETDEKYTVRRMQWQSDWDKWRGIVQGFIPKNRDGETGVAVWRFHGAQNRFEDTTLPGGCN